MRGIIALGKYQPLSDRPEIAGELIIEKVFCRALRSVHFFIELLVQIILQQHHQDHRS